MRNGIFLFTILLSGFSEMNIVRNVLYRCKPGLQTTAVIGLHRHSQPDNFTVRIPMSQCIVHPKYNRAGHQLHNNDIMLVKLAHPVEFNDAVSPVCLPTTLFQKLPHGKRCYSSGWGRLWSMYWYLRDVFNTN